MDKWNMQGNKLLWHMDRVLEWQYGKRIVPLFIDIGVTKKCNAVCCYCYGRKQLMNGETIPSDILIKLFTDAPKLGVKAASLTGDGENTLHPAIYDAILAGKNNGLDIGLATNGIVINDEQNKVLCENLVWFRYNISAATQETYKSIHGVNQFYKVLHNIGESVKIKRQSNLPVTIGLQMVLVPQCIDDVIPLSQIAIDYGVDYFVVKQFSDPGEGIPITYDQNQTDSNKWQSILQKAESMSNSLTQIIIKWPHLQRKGKRQYDRCVDGAFIFQISGNSKCYPCGYLFNNEEFCYGDLKKQSFEEIITSERYYKIIDKLRYDFDVHTECKGSCRHDESNLFIWKLLHPPEHINFI
jgi:MoaA/NifB/PqqE/SkfB family radical SAM enzyme